MAVSGFSTFSAVSELFVTAAVFHVLWRAYRHDDLRVGLLTVVLVFEAVVNMAYMTVRFVAPPPALERAAWMKVVMAAHGSLSLVMFCLLVAFTVEAARQRKEGRNLVRARPGATLAFVAAWTLSVASGEALYLGQLLG